MQKRVLLKISGEALADESQVGVHQDAAELVAQKIAELHTKGVEVGIVLGGGNIFRGIQGSGSFQLERTPADHLGMLSTMINGVLLERLLEKQGCSAKLLLAVDCPMIGERYNWDLAMRYLKEGNIVIFAGGTGHPYFTTDTAAALRASEIGAHLLLKATMHVDGIYNCDPRENPQAKRYQTISYQEVLDKHLGILDLTAVTLCMTQNIPIRVFKLEKSTTFVEALEDQKMGTLVN